VLSVSVKANQQIMVWIEKLVIGLFESHRSPLLAASILRIVVQVSRYKESLPNSKSWILRKFKLVSDSASQSASESAQTKGFLSYSLLRFIL
jgi:hypothetical protein